jgi:hypothetical protein
MKSKIIFAMAATAWLYLFDSETAQAAPMRCSGEQSTCKSGCLKKARTAVSDCLALCHVNQQICMRTGCWDNGASRYCGLLKQ